MIKEIALHMSAFQDKNPWNPWVINSHHEVIPFVEYESEDKNVMAVRFAQYEKYASKAFQFQLVFATLVILPNSIIHDYYDTLNILDEADTTGLDGWTEEDHYHFEKLRLEYNSASEKTRALWLHRLELEMKQKTRSDILVTDHYVP
jgi:hypothetical protein